MEIKFYAIFKFSDRSDGVKNIVERELIPAWLRLCKDDTVALMYALDVGNSDGKVINYHYSIITKI